MVTFTYDGSLSSDGFHVYFNGTNVDGATDYNYGTYTGMTNTIEPVTIGRYHASSDYIYFKGSIDDMKIYNRSLSASEIEELYNSQKKYKQEGYWLSANLSIPSNEQLSNLTINYSNADANNYIDKIELINADTGSVLSTYNGDLTSFSATSTVLNASDFDNGFSLTNSKNISVKIYFKTQGGSTPVITEVKAETEQAQQSSSSEVIVVSAPELTFKMVLLVFIAALFIFSFLRN